MSSPRAGESGPSWRSILTTTLLPGVMTSSVVVPGLRRDNRIGEALQRLELDPRPLGRPAGQGVLLPLVVARLPPRHELRVGGRLRGLRPGHHALRLLVAAPAPPPPP